MALPSAYCCLSSCPPHPQAVFNMEIWFPSHDNYKASHIGVRIMNIDKFVNSKRLFRTMRCERVLS